jgi:ketosteroid isomerase-like protein
VRVFRRGDLAWTTNTFGISARFKAGRALEAEGRAMVIGEKRAGQWWIMHDHASVPMG